MAEWTTPGLEPRDQPADFSTLIYFRLTATIRKAAPALNTMLRDIEAGSRQMQQRFSSRP